jgi:uncharacterized metal-binding protein
MNSHTKKIVKPPSPSCASCDKERDAKICFSKTGGGTRGCPTLTAQDVLAEANQEYAKPDVAEFAREASLQEAECYANRHQRPYVMQPTKTRMIEICEFAGRMGYQRVGLAFCLGLSKEAEVVEAILKTHGFEVVSVLCKAGRTSKDFIGIQENEKIFQGTDESMCNPIFQAKLMNHEKTEMNILLGLCVGHDSLFFKYAQAPTTVLAVKDRVTGHNPLAAIYTASSYYAKIRRPGIE